MKTTNQKVFNTTSDLNSKAVRRRSSLKMTNLRQNIRILSFMKKFQYFALFGVCGIILVVQISLCLSKYFQEPSYISSFIASQGNAEFPEITFCKQGGAYKEEVLQKYGFLSNDHYASTKNHTWQAANISSQDLFEKSTFNADELISSVYMRAIRADDDGTTGFRPKPGEQSDEAQWTTQYHRGFGRCHSLYPGKKIKKLGIYYMTIYGAEDVKMYLHYQGQFLDLSGRMGVKVYRNYTIEMQATWMSISMLSEQIKTVQKGFKCNNRMEYNACIYQKLDQYIRKGTSTGCTVPYMPNNTKICETQADRDAAFKIHYSRITNQAGDCPNPCNFLLMTLGGQNRAERTDDKFKVMLYFQSKTMINEESLLYTPLSLFAEIGGYVGLMMGFSIFHIAELISSVIERKIRSYEKKLEHEIEIRDTMSSRFDTVSKISH